ncbi:hypothetical protein niasHS_010272 [Heterodera schachtii]|uniref:Uncharacterized protein n=1 Tax=Heterodera schachtii TaxID=97005 RepID=A0ABD2J6Y3_HETSC
MELRQNEYESIPHASGRFSPKAIWPFQSRTESYRLVYISTIFGSGSYDQYLPKNVPSHLRYFYLIRAVWKIELVDEQRAEWEKRAEDEPHLVELSDNSPDLFDRILKREIDRKLYERSEAFEEFKLRENAFKEYFMNKYDKNLEIPSDSPFEKLLKAGGLVSIKNKAGWNSLDEAVANGDRNIGNDKRSNIDRTLPLISFELQTASNFNASTKKLLEQDHRDFTLEIKWKVTSWLLPARLRPEEIQSS